MAHSAGDAQAIRVRVRVRVRMVQEDAKPYNSRYGPIRDLTLTLTLTFTVSGIPLDLDPCEIFFSQQRIMAALSMSEQGAHEAVDLITARAENQAKERIAVTNAMEKKRALLKSTGYPPQDRDKAGLMKSMAMSAMGSSSSSVIHVQDNTSVNTISMVGEKSVRISLQQASMSDATQATQANPVMGSADGRGYSGPTVSFEEADKNGDGVIDREEFKRIQDFQQAPTSVVSSAVRNMSSFLTPFAESASQLQEEVQSPTPFAESASQLQEEVQSPGDLSAQVFASVTSPSTGYDSLDSYLGVKRRQSSLRGEGDRNTYISSDSSADRSKAGTSSKVDFDQVKKQVLSDLEKYGSQNGAMQRLGAFVNQEIPDKLEGQAPTLNRMNAANNKKAAYDTDKARVSGLLSRRLDLSPAGLNPLLKRI